MLAQTSGSLGQLQRPFECVRRRRRSGRTRGRHDDQLQGQVLSVKCAMSSGSLPRLCIERGKHVCMNPFHVFSKFRFTSLE